MASEASISPDCSSSAEASASSDFDWSEPESSSPPSSLVFLALRLVVVVLGLVVLLVVAELLGHLHRGQHVAHDAGKGLLVVELVEQAVDVGAGLLLDPVAPQIDDALAALRRGAAGQPLAHHQRHGFLDRRVGLVAHVGEVGLGELVLQHGAEIVGDALHGAGADRLDARLLDGVEDGARLLALGRQPGVDADVVAGAPAAPWNRRGRG